MTVQFNINDVFDIAEDIERGAGKFYTAAAIASPNAKCRRALHDLAVMESDHEQVFQGLRIKHGAEPAPRGTRVAPKGLFDFIAEDARKTLATKFTEHLPAADIISRAIEFEKDTIILFNGLRSMLKDSAERARIDEIIVEELGHVLSLTGQLAALKQPLP